MQSIHTIVNSVNKSTLRKYPMTTPPNRDTDHPRYSEYAGSIIHIVAKRYTLHNVHLYRSNRNVSVLSLFIIARRLPHRSDLLVCDIILARTTRTPYLIRFLYAICLVSLFFRTQQAWATTRLNLNSWMDLIFHSMVFSCMIHAQNLQHNKLRCARWWCIVPVWNIMSWHEWSWSKPSCRYDQYDRYLLPFQNRQHVCNSNSQFKCLYSLLLSSFYILIILFVILSFFILTQRSYGFAQRKVRLCFVHGIILHTVGVQTLQHQLRRWWHGRRQLGNERMNLEQFCIELIKMSVRISYYMRRRRLEHTYPHNRHLSRPSILRLPDRSADALRILRQSVHMPIRTAVGTAIHRRWYWPTAESVGQKTYMKTGFLYYYTIGRADRERN